jgi:RHS repeat-associated protein
VAEYWYDYTNMGSGSYWLLSDQLGSTTVTAYVDGTFASELRYKPWGEGRYSAGATPTSKQYTGQVHEASLGGAEGLYYYNARFYDPYLNRWCQPDSIIPDTYDPQSYDRYAYVKNNPVNFNDPTGHAQCSNWQSGCDEETGMTDAELAALHARRGTETASAERLAATRIATTGQDPITPDFWNGLSTGLDVMAWGLDLFSAGIVTSGLVFGAGIPAPLAAIPGLEGVPVATGALGAGIAEMAAQPYILTANVLTTLGTMASIIGDSETGGTNLAQGKFSNKVANSITLTVIGWGCNEAYISLLLQSVTLANDFNWISVPFH